VSALSRAPQAFAALVLLLAPLPLVLEGCPKSGAEPAVVDGARRLTILHTNDVHAHYLPERAEWLPGTPEIGGFVRLEEEVTSLRSIRAKESVLLLDGGDQLTGTPISDLVEAGAKGGAMHRFFELLHYDAWAVGNHEFDKGLDNLAAYTGGTSIPALSANVRGLDGGPLLPHQEYSHVFSRNGLRVGVIGVTTGRLNGLMSKADFARLHLLPEAEAVRAEVEKLDPVTDVIVVLSHIGVDQDERLAAEVPGIDVIVGAHSHTRLTAAEHVGDTWIVQAGSYNRELGVVDLAVTGDSVRDFHYELRDLTADSAPRPPLPAMQTLVDGYKQQLDKIYGEVVSSSEKTLTRDYHHENPLGRWVTDALRDATGVDVAFYNGGGLRADLVAGPVTRGNIFECFPFNNDVMTYQLSGKTLLGVVLSNLHAENDESRGYLSTSGLSWTWRVRGGAPEVVEARVNGKPLDVDATYTCASSSYVAEHWEKNFDSAPANVAGTGLTDYEAAVNFAKKGPILDVGGPRGVRVEPPPAGK